jgi:hypothetical protein
MRASARQLVQARVWVSLTGVRDSPRSTNSGAYPAGRATLLAQRISAAQQELRPTELASLQAILICTADRTLLLIDNGIAQYPDLFDLDFYDISLLQVFGRIHRHPDPLRRSCENHRPRV